MNSEAFSGESVEVGLRVTAALDYANSISDDVRDHYLWNVQQITDVVGFADLTTSELISLSALLIPAHSRVLAGREPPHDPPTARLRLIRKNSPA
jgi:hypothetical protein